MQIVHDKITLAELEKMSEKMFNQLVKAVVDIEQGILVVDAFMHADEEDLLLDEGSENSNLWGINLYPFNSLETFIEFDSMINIRPADSNCSRSVENPEIQAKIIAIVNQKVIR